jgi:hypothetical protein
MRKLILLVCLFLILKTHTYSQASGQLIEPDCFTCGDSANTTGVDIYFVMTFKEGDLVSSFISKIDSNAKNLSLFASTPDHVGQALERYWDKTVRVGPGNFFLIQDEKSGSLGFLIINRTDDNHFTTTLVGSDYRIPASLAHSSHIFIGVARRTLLANL